MKKFLVTLDLTLSGDFEIEAKNEAEAREQVMRKYLDNYAKSNMHELSREVYQIETI